MIEVLRLSRLGLKSLIMTRVFFLGALACIAYSLLWLIVISPESYPFDGYIIEFDRFFYAFIVYASSLILINDIRSNTIKIIFTGIYTRSEIMLSKIFSLVGLGIVFFLIAEVNYLLISLVKYQEFGLDPYLSLPHYYTLMNYIVITFLVGSLFLIVSLIFPNHSKLHLYMIIALASTNFFNYQIIIQIMEDNSIVEMLGLYSYTPWYHISYLLFFGFNKTSMLACLLFGILFSILALFIMKKREIH